ncbi:alpha/beta hydrolase [Streptomyces sp. NPDC006460]|uniref:alpha/beta hydrolase family protein n=1 Tax=Streptomyces sp. NPDC006460 TaxID=3154304 RepID=UPI0033AA9812
MVELTRTASAVLLACALALSVPLGAAAPAASATVIAPSSPGHAAAGPVATRARLPEPTGPYAVGSSVLHLVDRSRPDPWVPTADGRELMVTVHYPAARHGAGRPARYATTEEARLLVRGLGIESSVPARELAAMRTHSRVDARPAADGRHPLVLLSPGFGASRYTLTHLAEDLASRGYVVASVDHAYESFGTAVPGGRMLTCVACEVVDAGADPARVTSARAADAAFVLDRLTGPRAAWRHARMIDTARVGMAGHSIGGASAATAMAADRRIDAGIDMDGAFWGPLPPDGLGGRPFMMLGTDDEVHRPGGTDTTWDATWPRLGGWKRWLTVAGANHFTFSDSPVILGHFGLPGPALPSERAVALTRTYVAAFFDRHLRGLPQPLLDGPSAAHPEMTFHTP